MEIYCAELVTALGLIAGVWLRNHVDPESCDLILDRSLVQVPLTVFLETPYPACFSSLPASVPLLASTGSVLGVLKQGDLERTVQAEGEGNSEDHAEAEQEQEGPGAQDPEGPATQDPEGPDTQDPEGPDTQDPEGPDTRDPEGPDTRDPEGPDTRDPEGPVTRDPEGPDTQDPEGPDTQDPEGPDTRDPEGPVTRDPEGPDTQDPEGPDTQDPEGPVTRDPGSEPPSTSAEASTEPSQTSTVSQFTEDGDREQEIDVDVLSEGEQKVMDDESVFKVPKAKRKTNREGTGTRPKKMAALETADVNKGKDSDELSTSDSERESSDSTLPDGQKENGYSLEQIRFLQATKGKREVKVEDFFPNRLLFVASARWLMRNRGPEGLERPEVYRLQKLVQKVKLQLNDG
uniref:Uncharacterized protein n=1 Tax=Salarias fasciatus TaxID=181472 RepID=A0A672F2A1_SALFA